MSKEGKKAIVKGRGAQHNPHNRFFKHERLVAYPEGIDETDGPKAPPTHLYYDRPKKVVNRVESPDVGMGWSVNPYQGCEHGCIYCYARNSHEYWGFSSGLDFESNIVVKENAPDLLKEHLQKRVKVPEAITLSGNTDCYQPAERRLLLTRKMLQLFLDHRHPVAIITKSSMILRDTDILQELANMRLVKVAISVTSLDHELHNKMEPRTAAPHKRLKVIRELSAKGVPVMVMNAPIVPGLNDHEIPKILKQVADNGALDAAYTMVRLNGAIAGIFTDWIHKQYPLKAGKVLNRIKDCHGGKLNDSRWGKRMQGEGNIAKMVDQLFKKHKARYFSDKSMPPYDLTLYRPYKSGQLSLF